jgi:hypothetical protein
MEQIAQLVPPPLVAKCEFGNILRDGENVIHVRRAPLSLALTVSGSLVFKKAALTNISGTSCEEQLAY